MMNSSVNPAHGLAVRTDLENRNTHDLQVDGLMPSSRYFLRKTLTCGGNFLIFPLPESPSLIERYS